MEFGETKFDSELEERKSNSNSEVMSDYYNNSESDFVDYNEDEENEIF
jgi:hypothetical protein